MWWSERDEPEPQGMSKSVGCSVIDPTSTELDYFETHSESKSHGYDPLLDQNRNVRKMAKPRLNLPDAHMKAWNQTNKNIAGGGENPNRAQPGKSRTKLQVLFVDETRGM